MGEIPIGAQREDTVVVTPELAIDFLGVDSARVLATPRLIGLLEATCRNLLLAYLDPGQDSVGTHVDVRHLAATPLGIEVRLRAKIASVDGRRVNFQVEAYDELEKVAEGTHQRFIVEVARFAERVSAKARRAPSPGAA